MNRTKMALDALRAAKEYLQGLFGLLWESARALRRLEWQQGLLQAEQLLQGTSLFFIFVVMGFVGAILIVQASGQAVRIIGDLTLIGPGFLQLVVREFGPTIVALMVAARYGAGVAAELGAMQVTEQIDALRMAGAEAESYLVAPRIVGGLIGMLPLAVLGVAAAFFVGGVAGHYAFGIGWPTYFRTSMVSVSDVVVGVSKVLAYGVAVPLVASYAGLRARGGAPGVGRAATHAVIGGSTAILMLDFFIGALGHFVLG